MTTLAPFPNEKFRRASEIYRELIAASETLLPEWRGNRNENDFAQALLRIAARLSEEVTRRIAQTPRRDVAAFFEMLDLPVHPPRPAKAPLVFLLSEKRTTRVIAPARVQIGASTPNGEVIFETCKALNLTPARLKLLAAVDGSKDHIEVSPPHFLDLQKPAGPLPDFKAATFAATGSRQLQIEPAEGLEKGDLIRIKGIAYRLDEGKSGLFNLLDPLETDVAQSEKIEKVTQFDAFTLRDIQQHIVYFGHEELLLLDQPSTIYLNFDPPVLAQQLHALDIAWELYGKNDETDSTEWRPLTPSIVQSGVLRLYKSWTGSVEVTKIHDFDSRWIRARLKEKVTTTFSKLDRARSIKMMVTTGDPKTDPCEKKQAEVQSSVVDSEESEGISQAFNNNSPLPLTTRFLPFGPEPLRFDTFALAAPEALSKKGATVTLDVTLADAGIEAFDLAEVQTGPHRAYGISRSGRLQALAFDTKIAWQDLGGPKLEDLQATGQASAQPPDPAQLHLNPAVIPVAVQFTSGSTSDLVVVVDRGGRIWGRQVEIDGTNKFSPQAWCLLDQLKNPSQPFDLLLLGREMAATLFAVHENTPNQFQLQYLSLAINGNRVVPDAWKAPTVTVTAGGDPPSLGSKSRLFHLLPRDWPRVSQTTNPIPPREIMVLDETGHLWSAVVNLTAYTVTWSRFKTGSGANHSVRPAATKLPGGEIIVFAANGEDEKTLQCTSIKMNKTESFPPLSVRPHSAIQCLPQALIQSDSNGTPLKIPLASAVGTTGNGTSSQAAMTLWSPLGPLPTRRGNGLVTFPATVGVDDKPAGLLVPIRNNSMKTDDPVIVLNGKGESLYSDLLAIPFAPFDAVVFNRTPDNVYYTRLRAPNETQSVKLLTSVMKLEDGHHVHAVEPNMIKITSGDLHILESSLDILNGTRVSDYDFKVVPATNLISAGDTIIVNESLVYVVKSAQLLNGETIVKVNLPSEALPETLAVRSQVQSQYEQRNAQHDATLLKVPGLRFAPGQGQFLRFYDPTIQANPWEQRVPDSVLRANGDSWLFAPSAATPKPKSTTSCQIIGADPENWSAKVYDRIYQKPELSWEYFDGKSWRRLASNFIDGTHNFANGGDITFTVPEDLEQGEVSGKKDYWIRARLIGGDYGRPEYSVETIQGNAPNLSTQTIKVDTNKLQPPEIIRIKILIENTQCAFPQRLLVENNLQMADQSQANESPDALYDLYQGALAINDLKAESGKNEQALYFGFDKPLDITTLSLFLDAVDQDVKRTLIFETLGRDRWYRASPKDETLGFHRRGYIELSMNADLRKSRLFNQELYWLRVRPIDDNDAKWAPKLRGVYLNAVEAEQTKTIEHEVLGSGTGEPGLQFFLAETPVLPNSVDLRVQESLSGEEREHLLKADEQNVVQYPELALKGDWVKWKRVDTFLGQSNDARVYRVDPYSGEILFGDQTKVVPAGRDNIRVIQYQTVGGQSGNVAAYEIKSLKSAVEAVETVANPLQAAGGTDKPDINIQLAQAPGFVRRSRQALTPPDIESLLISTTSEIVSAKCLFPDTRGAPIRIALLIRSPQRCPTLTLVQRTEWANIVRAQAWGALKDKDIKVLSPEYVRIQLTMHLQARPSESVAAIEQQVSKRLMTLLHPAMGGPAKTGWPFGRRIWPADVLRAVAEVRPPEFGAQIMDLKPVNPKYDLNHLPPLGLICAEEEDVTVTVEQTEGES